MTQHYDEEKFKELMLYVARESEDDSYFGDVKLNKLLFYSDFLAYAYFGESITGAEYQKQEYGPVARRLLPVRDELVRNGDAEIVTKNRFYKQRVTVGRREARTRLFDTDKLELVDEVLKVFREADGSTLSAFAHANEVGWQIGELGETIPYQTVFLLAPDRLPKEAFEWAESIEVELEPA